MYMKTPKYYILVHTKLDIYVFITAQGL